MGHQVHPRDRGGECSELGGELHARRRGCRKKCGFDQPEYRESVRNRRTDSAIGPRVPSFRESGPEPSSEELRLGPSLENQARNEGRQSSQGRTLPPTFEKSREERAYKIKVSMNACMCQLFCMRNADCPLSVPPGKSSQRLRGSGVFLNE